MLTCQHNPSHRAMLVKDATTGETALIRIKTPSATVPVIAETRASTPTSVMATTTAAPAPQAGQPVLLAMNGDMPPGMLSGTAVPAPAPAADPQGGGGGGGAPVVDPPKPPVTPSHGVKFEPGNQTVGHIDATVGGWFSEAKGNGNDKSSTDMIVLWDTGIRWDPKEAGSGLFLGAHSQGIYSPAKYGSSGQDGIGCFEYMGSQGPFWEPHPVTAQGWERELLLGNAVGELGFSGFPYLSLIGGAVFTDQDIKGAVGLGIEYGNKWLDLRADPMFIPDGSDFAVMGRLMLKPTQWLSIGGVAHVVGNDWAAGPMARLDVYRLVGGKSKHFSLGVDGGYLWSSQEAPSGWNPAFDYASGASMRNDAPWTGNYRLQSASSGGGDSQERQGAFVGASARWTF